MDNMDTRDEFARMGRTIERTVRDVLSSRDCQQLKQMAQNFGSEVRDFGQEVGREARQAAERVKEQASQYSNININSNSNSNVNQSQNRSQGQNPNMGAQAGPAYQPKYRAARTPGSKMPSVSVSGLLLTIFGGLLTVVFLFLSVIMGTASLISSGMPLAVQFVSAVFYFLLALGLVMLVSGIAMLAKHSRYRRYEKLMAGRKFREVQDMAKELGCSQAKVVRDLRKIIRSGWMPGVFLDSENTCLFADQEVYQEYLQARQKMEEERRRQKERQKNPPSELERTLEDGRAYIVKIQTANSRILAQEPSQKIDRLQNVTKNIFEYVEKHPAQLPEIRKFMSYYLPMTLKLLDAYSEFEAQPVQGENIQAARREIEQTLDVIIQAFEKLLDGLFQDDAMDISSDISVLNAMLAQEGLTGGGLSSQEDLNAQ